MRIIFLDCDGVLNSHTFFASAEQRQDAAEGGLSFGEAQIDPSALALLDRLVEQTGAQIVISSSWRHIWNWQEIARMFERRGMENWDFVIDQTPTSQTDHRGTEVQEWLDMGRERQVVDDNFEPVTSWVIIDDTDEFDATQRQNFVRTNAKVGLTQADVQRAAQILKRG
jgi:hypothetical protein